MMFVINVRLAVVSLITLPMMALISRWISKRTRKGFRDQQERLGDLNGIIEESVTGQRVIKAYVREHVVIDEFDATNDAHCARRLPGPDLWPARWGR